MWSLVRDAVVAVLIVGLIVIVVENRNEPLDPHIAAVLKSL